MKSNCLTCDELVRLGVQPSAYTTFPGAPSLLKDKIFVGFIDHSPDMLPEQQEAELQLVIEQLNEVVTPIQIIHVRLDKQALNTKLDIQINFAQNKDQDFPYTFDPSTLALAEAPQFNFSRIFVNDVFDWNTESSGRFQDLGQTLLHEIIHYLGLGHSDNPNDIMYFQSGGAGLITQDTIDGLNHLQGEFKKTIVIPEPEIVKEKPPCGCTNK